MTAASSNAGLGAIVFVSLIFFSLKEELDIPSLCLLKLLTSSEKNGPFNGSLHEGPHLKPYASCPVSPDHGTRVRDYTPGKPGCQAVGQVVPLGPSSSLFQ